MNRVLMLVRNNLELTKRAIQSVLDQDIPVTLYVVDNDSAPEIRDFLRESKVLSWRMTPAKGVSASWNFGLDYLFETAQCKHVVVVNNDVELRHDTVRELIEDHGLFVTAVSVDNPDQLQWDGVIRKRPHPDFSCFKIRREVWQTVGKFDESMVHYCSDGDYHLRMHQAGIEAYTIGIPFFHYASGTLKSADPDEKATILKQADADRDAFAKKWGCRIGSPEYYAKFNGTTP